ncbi:MAG: glycosyltransferase family 4 protein [Chloroflexi bacterium]|nr:glycosyltransferase family 4 protein [Chloroflexota bacterium]
MKRILFASWYAGLGGGETDLLTLAGSLDVGDYECHLLLPEDGQLSEIWRETVGPVHIIPFRGATTYFVPAVWARFPVVKRFARLLRDERINLAHSDYHSLPMIAPAAQLAGLPFVFTLWGWWFKPKPWQRSFFRDIPKTVARSIAIREGYLGEPPFMPVADVPVVYPGVDTERFHPDLNGARLRDELGIAQVAPLVAMVARFQRVKGHHSFQSVAEAIARQEPEARFVVAGDNVFGVDADGRYRDQILQAAKNNDLLRDRIQYIGFRDDIEHVYAAADVVVCASEFESFGKANLEAMACGLPVVSSNRGGPAETVRQGETGFLIDPGDMDGFSRAVTRLLADAGLREKMGRAGRARVCERFSIDAMTEAYCRIFDDLLRLNSR